MSIPTFPDLFQDNSIVIYEHMNGAARYRMSMVSSGWHVYCSRNVRVITREKQWIAAIKNNDMLEIVKYRRFINRWNSIFPFCKYCSNELIDIMLEGDGYDWQTRLDVACRSGKMYAVQRVLSRISPDIKIDWMRALAYACGGTMDVIQLMIDKVMSAGGMFYWNFAIPFICSSGNIDIVQFVIDRGADAWNEGLLYACMNGKMDMVLLMLKKGANSLHMGLEYACIGGNVEIVKLMIEKGASNWDDALYYACVGGNIDIIQLIIEKGATDWNSGLVGACHSGNIELVRTMIANGATALNRGFHAACESDHMDIVLLLMELGANNWNDGLECGCYYDHHDIMQLMIANGATVCEGCTNNIQHHLDRMLKEM